MQDLTKISRFLALVLRHKPEEIGIRLDPQGWARVDEILDGMKIDFNTLKEIVETDNKQRYSFNEDSTMIRANQGHSVHVDVGLKKVTPPEILYHGTGVKYKSSIELQGLIPKSRLYVHLSDNEETALNVGARHGKPFVYIVHSGEMSRDGHEFFLSENGVWLTKEVPLQYLEWRE